MSTRIRVPSVVVVLVGVVVVSIWATAGGEAEARESFPVSGQAVAFASDAVVHSQEPTANGMIERSTSTILLQGDLEGHVLFHATSEFDFVDQTLVNTGTQIFSGTVKDSPPVILHDDEFRFEVDLATGDTVGEVHLDRSNDAPHHGFWYACDLTIVGTGQTPQGDFLSDYQGQCTRRGQPAASSD